MYGLDVLTYLLLLLLGLLGGFLGVAVLLALLGLGDGKILHLAIGSCGFSHVGTFLERAISAFVKVWLA
jgi:hypothetical protein